MSAPDVSTIPPRAYLPEEVAQMLALPSAEAVWKLARRGKIPGAIKIGNKWRFNRERFDQYLQGAQAA